MPSNAPKPVTTDRRIHFDAVDAKFLSLDLQPFPPTWERIDAADARL